MDTSENYIKMCWKAQEIQNTLPRNTDEAGESYIDGTTYILKYSAEYKTIVWLPRQDQLQEMIGSIPGNYKLEPNSGYWAWAFAKTWEQLWLAFVMKEKFNKTWNDEKQEWIKEK